MRIVIADGQPKVRRALRVLLEQVGRDEIAGEATDAASLLARVATVGTDLVLLDGALLGLTTVELLEVLRRAFPGTRAIVLSTRTEAGPDALRAGAAAFVSKSDPAERLLAAIEECRPPREGVRGRG